jgi:hypothetical protein
MKQATTIIYQLEDGQQHSPATFFNLDSLAFHVDVYFNRIPYDIRGIVGFHYQDGKSMVFEASKANIPDNKEDILKYFKEIFDTTLNL